MPKIYAFCGLSPAPRVAGKREPREGLANCKNYLCVTYPDGPDAARLASLPPAGRKEQDSIVRVLSNNLMSDGAILVWDTFFSRINHKKRK